MLVAFEGQVRTQKSDWVQIDDRLCNLVLTLAVMKLLLSLKVCMKKTCPQKVWLKQACFYMSLVMRKPAFAYAKTKMQISFAVTAKLISAFVSATQIVQFLFFLNLKFQASNHLLWPYSLVCVRPGRRPRRPVFSQ